MIYVLATVTIKPGSRDAVLEAAKPCIEATLREAGCIRYDLTENMCNPDQLVFVEQWKARADLDLHFEQAHMKNWREAGGPFIIDRRIEIIHPEKIEEL